MGLKSCMNEVCRATTSSDSKKGWSLKSGGFAKLCYKCGDAYENSVFCETYHSEESGWRECRICGKIVHCGCIGSRHLFEHLDFGGVACISCSKRLEIHSSRNCSSVFAKPDYSRPKQVVKDITVEVSEQTEGSSPHGQRGRHISPKPPKPSPVSGSEANIGSASQTRVPRPPAEGQDRNQLLPCYRPRITDQELQQLSRDLKSTIVPLFEKTLSASDAGRNGRMVLPKACAEAYFPTINQSEGIPIRIQDIKGKEWIFHFRFWPNNNSRMYVLEGVTPCIKNMQLEAGDTVIFSRMDPGSQLVIGCRKAAYNADVLEPQTPAVLNSDSPREASFTDAQPSNGGRVSDDSQLQHATISEKKKARNIKNKRLLMNNDDATELRGTWEEAQELFRPSPSSEPTVVMVEDHEFEEFEEPQTPAALNGDSPGEASFTDAQPSNGGRVSDDTQLQHTTISEKKAARNIKNKRLLMNNDDFTELRDTWEEAQELFRPSPSSEPTVVMVEDHEFEEFEEPPVFGKRTVFISQASGNHVEKK